MTATITLPPPEDTELAAKHAQTVVCLSKLPPFHPAALKLLNISSESGTAMDDFERIFKGDPALTADLLLVANSPLFGTKASISSIRHALTLLGLDRVRSLGTTIALSFFVRNQPRSGFVRHIWAHSVATATISEVLGNTYRLKDLYTAGLVHDLGRLGLLLTVGQDYEKWVTGAVPSLDESIQLERASFGMNHCEAGALVGHQWRFPVVLRSCMVSHHEPVSEPPNDPVSLVQLACRMATALGYPEIYTEPEPFPELPPKARGCAELAHDRIEAKVKAQIDMIGK